MSSEQKTTTTTTATASADAPPAFQLNVKKLKELSEQASAIKIGGKVSEFQSKEKHVFIHISFRAQPVVRRKLFIVQPMLMTKNSKVH